MSNVSYQTVIALKEAGLSQPTPQPGQFWYGPKRGPLWLVLTDKHGPLFTQLGTTDHINEYFDAMVGFVFAPTLEYIVPLLPIPELFHFEIWNNTPSCRFRDDENPRRTFGETFAEAAAKMYLELKQNAPNQTFVQPGDAEQE